MSILPRIDRFTTVYVIKPLLREATSGSQIPILMYHSIGDVDEGPMHAYYRTSTAPHIFEKQMEYLRQRGYSAISLEQLNYRLDRRADTEKCVVITFDDGYKNFYDCAFPILEKYGLSATVFLATRFIGKIRQAFNGNSCLTWSEVRELSKCGVNFGSHTVSHPRLRDIGRSRLDEELIHSKLKIEHELGIGASSFAYPYAFPQSDTEFVNLLRNRIQVAGYTNGVCTTIGRAKWCDDRFFLKRLPVNSCDDEALFEAKILGAYDWVSTPQLWGKIAKSWLRGCDLIHRRITSPDEVKG
jgi:peptidoglycan/xylan/chitin deacetylase (PgdA/CDA1 family)